MVKNGVSPTAARGLTRQQVAEFLGVTDREVARMDGRQLHPTRAPDRVWRYDVAEVKELLAREMLNDVDRRDATDVDGETTATVFALFAARKPLAKVVIATRQPANVIKRLRAQYDDLRNSVTISPTLASELSATLGQPFRDGRDMLAAVRRALEIRFDEGRADAHEFGQVLDPSTGKLRPVAPPSEATGPQQRSAPVVEEQREVGHDEPK